MDVLEVRDTPGMQSGEAVVAIENATKKMDELQEDDVMETPVDRVSPDHESAEAKEKDDSFDSTVDIPESPEAIASLKPCRFNFEVSVRKITEARATFRDSSLVNNFVKGCKWSPDGMCIVSNSEDNILRVFNLPDVFFNPEDSDWSAVPPMAPVFLVKEPSTIYDYCWYPLMDSNDPSTCCLVSCTNSNPIHVWDGFTGQLRCSYRAYNHLDEIVGAFCLAFDPQGRHLYCGYEKCIRIFDVSNPGRECTTRNLKGQGQPGIISCIAVSPVDSDMYAVGSYLRMVGLYTEPKGKQLFCLSGHQGGITHLKFSSDGVKLYSGGRKDSEIICWDLRNPGKVLYRAERKVTTNQRIYFDLDESNRYLVSGNTDGQVTVWDTSLPTIEVDDGEPILQCVQQFQAHSDCTNGVSLNPVCSLLMTAGGIRKFQSVVESDSEDELLQDFDWDACDNSMTLWWIEPKQVSGDA